MPRDHDPTATLTRAILLCGAVLVLLGDPAAALVHVVEAGETLSELAVRYQLTRAELAGANDIRDPDLIYAGAELRIPEEGGMASAAGSGSEVDASAAAIPAGGAGTPVVRTAVGQVIEQTAARYGWRSATIKALAMAESGWNNAVVSPSGATGIMQVLPATAEWVGARIVGRPLDLNDHADNVEAGVAYLDYLYNRYDGDVELALAAYYLGPGNVTGGTVPPVAEHYVATVMALRERF